MTRATAANPPRSRDATARLVFAATAILLVVAAVALWSAVVFRSHSVPVPEPALYVPVVLLAAFVAGELFPLRFDTRDEVLLVSLSELPLVLGVLLMPGWLVGVVYVVGGLVAFAIRRGDWRSAVLNVALIAVECAVAVLLTEALADDAIGGTLLVAAQPRFLPVAAGVMAGALVSAAVVAISRRLSGDHASIAKMVGWPMLTAGIIVGLALAGFTVWVALPAGGVLCLVLLAVCIMLYRNYFAFVQQHAGLAELYEFGAMVTRASGSLDAWQDLVGRVRNQVDARVAAVYFTDRPTGATVLAAGPNGPLALDEPAADDPLFRRARRDGFAMTNRDGQADPDIREALAARGATEVMVVALRSGGRDRGYLEVRDRRSRWARFTDDDATLVQTLAGHLATALDNHRLLARLQHEAYHDSVTGLANRSGLEMRSAELADSGRYGGVLLMDLGVLGEVVGALGHDHGEHLLATVAARLSEAAGPQRVLGRVDADLFAMVVEPQSDDSAVTVARTMLAAAAEPVAVDGMEIEPSPVGGIALCETADGPVTPSVLLQQAQLALDLARSKDDDLAVYQPAIGEGYQRRFQLVSQFRHAVDSGRVSLHYQPKVTLVDRELIGVEALVRWKHPEYGFVSPAELIDAIENTSAIDVLFGHVLDQALRQVKQWSARGMSIPIAVNLSVRNLLAPNFVDTVTSALADHQVPAEMLTLEVTESSVMGQPERTMPILRGLHSLGIGLSVDDFGTGYSSLAYLRRLPIDELKIDKSFVQGMVTDLGDLAIVRAIIDLGRSLGLRVVAEGVEEEAGRDALRSMRCDAMQGFLLARPLAIDRFESWLTSRTVPASDDISSGPVALRMRS